ncbi:probable multidrug resistance-associated protein lethal(2)03659 isoform X2 [Bradysia coprophila]|nr:probable multidrug resistance-associated protein lethal(2)03659 isoform X2 [Bradysia coprophila]
MADDVDQFGRTFEHLHHTWKGPVESVIFAYFIYREIGVAGVVGCSLLLCFMPLQAFLSRKATKLQTKLSRQTEERVRLMNETIIGIRVIKMFGMEHVSKDVITNVRSSEMVLIQSLQRIHALLVTLSLLTRLSILVSIVTYLYLGELITPHKEFIIFAFFNLLNWSMLWQWPFALIQCGQGYVAIQRIQKFLLNEEMSRNVWIENGDSDATLNRTVFPKKSNETIAIQLENVTSTWCAGNNRMAGIFNSSLNVARGELCALIGPVGSGKSTLLHAVTGELNIKKGFCEIYGKVSYASQMPWIFEGTVRQNIIFSEPFDEEKFQNVIGVCCLQNDIERMPRKDLTLVGECGFTLSGGQRSRISIARAVYQNADIYIFDDVLAAVNFKIGKYIVQHCVQEYLTGRTRIIVTNELQYFKYAQHLVVMSDGRIEADGTFEEIQNKGLLSFCRLNATDVVTTDAKYQTQKSLTSLLTVLGDDNFNVRNVEKQYEGSRVDVYKFYFKSIRSVHFLVLVAFLLIISQFFAGGTDYFISSWNTATSWEISLSRSKIKTFSLRTYNSSNEPDTVLTKDADVWLNENSPFVSLNCGLMAALAVATVYRTFQFFELCLSASIALHDDLFLSVLRAKMKFFDSNPTGWILKRFSKDLLNIDTRLPQALIEFLSFTLELLSSIIMVLTVDCWLLVPSTIITIFFCALRYVFTNTTKCVQRIESISLGPLYSYVNNTLQGLSTIRISNVDNILQEEFYAHLDFNTAITYLKTMTARAFSAWVDGICLVYIGICALIFVLYGDSASSNYFGFALLHCINLIGMCQWGTRDSTEIEYEMTSVERIIEYTKIKSEPPLNIPSDHHPPKHWPSHGEIIFKNVDFKYSNSRALVLKNINFRINPGEKIGIIGYTGAGKSSIIEAIFRMQEYSGEIIIDGILTTTLGLHDLRKNISYIPQNPILFSATLRFNLDPFGEAADVELWNALNQVEMKEFIKTLPGGLDYKLVQGGLNFSMGQRQLISLARAIIRNKKIFISDEATANVDPETDRLIQETIRLNFNSCTVLTISHQLYNIMDSDRILVLENGRIVELDRPLVLLQKTDGYLRKYCHDPARIEMLTNLARKSSFD